MQRLHSLFRDPVFLAGPCRGTHRLRRPIRRAGHCRHAAPPQLHPRLLDLRSARLPLGVSRVRRPRARRPPAKLVWHRPVAPDAARGHHRHRASKTCRIFAHYKNTDPTVRNIFVSYTTNILVTVLTALVCFRLLRQFGFTVNHSIFGVLALLIATTHLHYTQNMMENNYIFLLTASGILLRIRMAPQPAAVARCCIGTGAFGLNLLTRLTTGLDLLAGSRLRPADPLVRRTRTALLAAPAQLCRHRHPRLLLLRPARSPLPVLPLRLLHQHLRQRRRQGNPRAPSRLAQRPIRLKRPFTTASSVLSSRPKNPSSSSIRFSSSPSSSTVLGWKRFTPAVRAYTIVYRASCCSAYICFYARYTVWSGDDRLGRSLRLHLRRTRGPCSPSPSCCAIAPNSASPSGLPASLCSPSAPSFNSLRSPSGFPSRSTRWRTSAIPPSSSPCA